MQPVQSHKTPKSLLLLLAFGLMVSLAGCVQKLPSPSEDAKTLLVVATEVVNKGQRNRMFNYIMKFERKPESGSWWRGATDPDPNDERFFSKQVALKRNGENLFLVYELPPGEYRLFSMTEVPVNVSNAQTKTTRMRVRPFMLEEEKITIYFSKFYYTQKFTTKGWFTSRKRLIPLKHEDFEKIRTQLKAFKNFELWSFAESS